MKTLPWLIIVHVLFFTLPKLQAHFPWLNSSTDGKAVYFFGESLAEKTYKLPPTIAKAKVWLISDAGQSIPLELINVSSDKFLGLVSKDKVPPESNLASKVTYGIFGTSRLDYYTMHLGGKLPKTHDDNLLGKLKWNLQAGIVETEDGIEVQVSWKGKPLSGTEIHLYGADGEENGTGELDSRGIITFSNKQVVNGVNGIMFGHRVPGDSGLFNGQEYDSSSHYFTLTFHDPENRDKSAGQNSSTLLKPLPTTLTSFGAARLGEYLYVFSGHQGTTHGFSIEGVSNHFRRIRFNDPSAEWEELSMHEGAQSTALVSDGKYLYRVGGLTFNNKADQDTDFKSTNHFARYDVDSDTWTELTPLPVSRSSLDAAVLGRSVFVAGGWNLQGASSNDATWHDDILRYDLDNPTQGWKSIKGPGYITRAASVAAYRNRLYIFGGIQTSSISRKVSIFDPETNTWAAGPDLPSDSSAAGFATSSFSTGGSLYVSGDSGIVYKLHEGPTAWKSVGRLMYPRMFHRLIPADPQTLLAIGGTSMRGGRMASIESFSVNRESNAPTAIQWSNKIDGNVTLNQSIVLSGSKLYAFGGRTQNDPQSDLSDEAYLFNLQRQTVEPLPSLPVATEGAKPVVTAQTSEHSQILLFGGTHYEGKTAAPAKPILVYDPDSRQWTALDNEFPHPLSDLSVVAKQDAVWFFGTQPTGNNHPVLHWWVDETKIAPIPDSTPPNPRNSFAGVADADAYYMVGGLDDNKQAPSSIDIFDFNTRSGRSASPPKSTRRSPDLVIANKKLYLFGGDSPESSDGPVNNTIEVYDIATDQWSNFAHPLPEIDSSMRLFSFNDRLLFYDIDQKKKGVVNFILLDPEPLASPGTVAAMDFSSTSSENDEVVNSTKLLMRRDTNRDGKLTKDELGSRLATLIKEGDSNSDGNISYAELKRVMESRVKSEKE
ncbi:MAG: kelch repeat-containing protein, partial [Planctomycetota bacterium]|nr:kelch repeat-containing protein [Planctomycetota bacterium]